MKKGLFSSKASINETTKKQMDRWESENVRVAQGRPMLCTAYAVNLEASSVYFGTEDVKEPVGASSPIRYDKIKDFRIIIDSELFGPDTKEDYGWQIDTQLNVLLYPGLANLEDNSIVVFNHMPNLYFIVTNSNLARVMPNTYSSSQLAVHFVSSDPRAKLIENQVVKEWTVEKFNQGTYVMSDAVLKKRSELISILDDALETYIATFYDEKLNSICIKNSQEILYDPYLQRFLQKNKVLSTDNMKDFLLTSKEVILDEKFDILYKRSIYGRVEKKKSIKPDNLVFFSYPFYAESHSWSRLYEFYKEQSIRIVTRIDAARSEDVEYDDTIYPQPHDVDTLDEIIAIYLSDDLNNINSNIFDILEDYDLEEDADTIVKFAICLFILKEKIKSLKGRNMDSNIIKEVV